MKKRYRVTRRGYIVFSLTGLLMIALMVWGVQSLTASQVAGNQSVGVEQATTSAGTETSSQTSNSQTGTEKTTDEKAPPSTVGPANASGTTQTNSTSPSSSTPQKTTLPKDLSTLNARIYFEPNKFDLSNTYYNDLEKITQIVLEHDQLVIIIEGNYNGYPDYKSSKFWTKLANDRAEVVRAYFVAKGISEERLKVVNNGCKKMINKDDSWEEIAKNRRVDVIIKENK